MRSYYITFRSVTFAQRGERVLGGTGTRCTLLRTPRWMEEQGCGYALKIWVKDVAPAVDVLREKGVPMRRVYAQRGDGTLEEISV